MAESAAPILTVERLHDLPDHLPHLLHHELRDALAALDVVVAVGVGVEQHHLDLAAVRGVDEAGRVHDADAVLQREAAAGHDEAGPSRRDRDRDTGRDQCSSAACFDDDVRSCAQVEPGVAGVGVRREGQVGVELDDRHEQHRWNDSTLLAMSTRQHPPSVDTLARSLASSGLPHTICVDIARAAIAADDVSGAAARAEAFRRTLLTPVVNATGVLLHTNLGRAPVGHHQEPQPVNVEFDLATGERGSRQRAVGQLFARLCGAESAMIVNNNAAAVLLVVGALASGRSVAVSRGESVEIGGSFRVPEVMEQSGARLRDVGTTNRTRLADYRRAVADGDVALVLKVHPSNYRVKGFVEDTSVAELATLGVPVVADIGSGLIDAGCPWLSGPPPAWLADEPAAVQTLAAGADLVTFSADKLFGGPQAGVIAGRSDLVAACQRHPLARALRPGGLTLAALQHTALAYLHRRVVDEVPFWRMVATPLADLQRRAAAIAERVPAARPVSLEALPGAGSAPGSTMPSFGLELAGDHLQALRAHDPPVVARGRDGSTLVDLRTVEPADDDHVAAALLAALAAAPGGARNGQVAS